MWLHGIFQMVDPNLNISFSQIETPKFLFATIITIWTNFLLDILLFVVDWITGGRLNKKDGLTRYGNSHVKDKTS